MKTALVTTTINVPTVLALYRKLDPDVHFFIVGDLKSPHADILDFLNLLENWTYLPPLMQRQWLCSDAIGWNCVQRRSVGFLEALRWGADVIVTIDDDNIPMGRDYFDRFAFVLHPSDFFTEDFFNGLQVSSPTRWYQPYVGFNHRGFPMSKRSEMEVSFAVDAKVGVAAGICLGDPDVDAVTRIGNPAYGGGSAALPDGYVVALNTHTVFNSQNTAFLREFAPAMFMLPGVGRYDDIIASLLTQRVMRDRGYHVHIGPPFVWQQRNPHNLLTDLKNELWGMEHVLEVSQHIDRMPDTFTSDIRQPLVEFVRAFYEGCRILPEQTRVAGQLWCDDIEPVMGSTRWKVYLEDLIRIGMLGHRMYIMRHDDPMSEDLSVVTNMTFEHVERGSFVSTDKASLDDSKVMEHDVRGFLQAMSDAAWEIGIKPKQIEDSRQELKATKYRLEDMRKLALPHE